MRDRENHDVEPVHLTQGWIGICATCGWVGENHGSKDEAREESRRHAEMASLADPPPA